MQPIIDFIIPSQTDPRVLIIDDNSIWGDIKNLVSAIEITMPGANKAKWFYFGKNTRNIYNSITLGISCVDDCECDWEYVDLPDGIYTIKVMGTPPDINAEKQYLRTSATRIKLDKLWVELDLLNTALDKLKAEKITEIDIMLTSAEANVRLGFNSDGVELFNRAIKLLERCG